MQSDIEYMNRALDLAREGLGRVAPNPSVGCVIVKGGKVIGQARTADGGRPHAEPQALAQAGGAAEGATVYVSLEPCAHEGQTPSCAKTLVAAGVRRVVVACTDPDPRTAGQGLQILREAGIEVVSGILEAEARALNKGFFLSIEEKRPFVTLKTASTKDGFVAPPDGARTRITSEESHERVHQLRAQHDAILVGIGTVLADDPLLTTRVPGLEHKGVRVVLDRHLRTPLNSQLVQTVCETPLLILSSRRKPGSCSVNYPDPGFCRDDILSKAIQILEYDGSIASALNVLAEQGITRLFVEGGPTIHAAFLKEGFCDRLLWFKSPNEMGEGIPAFSSPDLKKIGLERTECASFGPDVLEVYEPRMDTNIHE